MTFNDWYEQYERDGGELMLFNTIDLRAAFMAGADAANTLPHRAMFDEGIRVGETVTAKECAEIAMSYHHGGTCQINNRCRPCVISEAIRDKFKLSR